MCPEIIRSNLIMHFILFILWETQYCQFIPHLLESDSYLYSSVFLPFWLQFPPPPFFSSYSLMFSDSKIILVILSWYSQVHIVHFQNVVSNIFLFHKSVFELLFWLRSIPCFDFLLQEFLSAVCSIFFACLQYLSLFLKSFLSLFLSLDFFSLFYLLFFLRDCFYLLLSSFLECVFPLFLILTWVMSFYSSYICYSFMLCHFLKVF